MRETTNERLILLTADAAVRSESTRTIAMPINSRCSAKVIHPYFRNCSHNRFDFLAFIERIFRQIRIKYSSCVVPHQISRQRTIIIELKCQFKSTNEP